jgi:beta-lactamase class A
MKKNKRSTIWALIIIVTIVVFGVAYLMVKPSDTQTKKQPTKSVTKKTEKVVKTNKSVEQIMSKDLTGLSGTTSSYFYDLNSKQHAQYGENKPQRAASDIKFYIMATVFQNVKDGKLNLADEYTLADSDKVGGTGVLQNMTGGTKISYQDLVKDMMTQSDNTASNVLIEKVGGLSAVNREIKKLGLPDTKMNRMLMDTKKLSAGQDNMTSVQDMATFLEKLYHHQVVSKQYDQEMLQLMTENTNHTKLPAKVDSNITVYNKTGEFESYGVQNDAGIFKKGNKAIIITVMSENGDQNQQIKAMSNLGSDITNNVF